MPASPRPSRAEHHLRFADWLHERAGDELLEIRAFHFDQASALLAELDGAPPADLATRAAKVLEQAGRPRPLAGGLPWRAPLAPARRRARADSGAPLVRCAGGRADGRLAGRAARDGRGS